MNVAYTAFTPGPEPVMHIVVIKEFIELTI